MSITVVGPDGRPRQVEVMQLLQTLSLQDNQLCALIAAQLDAAHIQAGHGHVPAEQLVDRALELFVYSLWAFRGAVQDRHMAAAQRAWGLADSRDDEPPKPPRGVAVPGEVGV